MAFACLWSVLSPVILGCGPLEARALDCRRFPTLAPSAVPRRHQETKLRLQHWHAAAAAATAIITVVLNWSLLCAFPPTSRRCYRSTTTASHVRLIMRILLVSFFLLGSRAALVATNKNNSDTHVADGSQLADVSYISVWQDGGRQLAETIQRPLVDIVLPWILGVLLLVTSAGIVSHMMPGLGGGSRTENFNYRIPPSWSPENDSSYSFRAYMTDISLWVMLTDLAPHQQCAAIIMRLGGGARELARMISPQEIVTGGWRDGQLLDPVTYLLGALQLRFADLEEETRLQSMTEMLAFARRSGETINAMLARYEVVRQRAANE